MAVTAMFVALMVASGWALALVPNVELVTALAFVAGATLGPRLGALIGATGMFVFSATNPVGSGLAFPLLLATQIIGQAMMGLLGGLFVRWPVKRLEQPGGRLLLALAGLTGTVFYDGLTSISFPLLSGAGTAEIISFLMAGLAFTLLHQASNVLIFYLVVPRLIGISRGRQGVLPEPAAPATSAEPTP